MTRENIKKRAKELSAQNSETGIFAAAVPGFLTALAGILSPLAASGFLMGKNKVFLDIARLGKGHLEDIFDGFKNSKKYTNGLLLYVIKYIYIAIGTLLLIVPGIILRLRFLFAELILADETDCTVQEALNKSRFLTKERMGEVFAFELSFLPWFILGCIPIIGWVLLIFRIIPYYKVALAAYYFTLKDEAIRAAERKAKFRYPGGTPTRKRLDAGAAAADQTLAQQQAHAAQQAYAQQQAYYDYQAAQQAAQQPPQNTQQ
ncbi:MAG: DUF975 family protein [Clostridia bacterium]|nr:DUF975 family protein [Clostridia bacterium]